MDSPGPRCTVPPNGCERGRPRDRRRAPRLSQPAGAGILEAGRGAPGTAPHDGRDVSRPTPREDPVKPRRRGGAVSWRVSRAVGGGTVDTLAPTYSGAVKIGGQGRKPCQGLEVHDAHSAEGSSAGMWRTRMRWGRRPGGDVRPARHPNGDHGARIWTVDDPDRRHESTPETDDATTGDAGGYRRGGAAAGPSGRRPTTRTPCTAHAAPPRSWSPAGTTPA